MKPHLLAAALAAIALTGPSLTYAQADDAQAQAQGARDEAAGLPNLSKINRPVGSTVTTHVDINDVQRQPSYHSVDSHGTEITEFRDHGKPVEINVKSSFGTHYQMSSSPDTSPQPRDPNAPVTRLPSIHLNY